MVTRVREHMADVSIEQNLLEMDLTWSEPEIISCMKLAADRFNEMNPQVVTISPSCNKYPAMFLDGVGYYMLRMKIMGWMRNDVSFTAGNMETSPHKARIKHLQPVAKDLQESFITQIKEIKVAANAKAAFCSY